MDLSDFRQDYRKATLRREDLLATPMAQLQQWLADAIAAKVYEPNAMSVATSADGQPWSRTVLLKKLDERGCVFFTNYHSLKARQIEANPQVAANVVWLAMERQVVILGRVEKISREESAEYFATRPRESKLGAWVSHQSSEIASREELEREFAKIEGEWEGREVELPDFWGGFRIVPTRVEFWQGGPGRLHDRLVFTKQGDETWEISRLSP